MQEAKNGFLTTPFIFMSLKQKIANDLKEAMKAGDALKRDTLRMIDSMIKNVEIEKMKKDTGLQDNEVMEVISRAVKQRKDSILQYETGGRADLAEKEEEEVKILMEYLPKQLSEEEVRSIVRNVVAETGASGKADIGKVMGTAMGRVKGQADGNLVKKIAEEELK